MKKQKILFNTRQQKYKKNIIAGMSRYNAALAAGYSENTALKHTKELDKRINMPDVMERCGLTNKYLADKLTELLNATKVVGYLHNYKAGDKGGIEKIKPDEAVSNEFIEVPDWTARAKGLELVGKFGGKLIEKIDHSVAITYSEMKRIIIEDKRQELDIGEEIPKAVKERMQ